MKKLLLLLAVVMFSSHGVSQTQDQIKAWQDNMTPGKYHKWLATFDGEWVGDVKMWMDPSQPPQASKMSTTNTMIMNGLYQKSSHEGIMMGMPFKGQGLIGYDNIKKIYISTWIDNMGSSIMIMDGNVDKDEKILTTTGTMDDPMTGDTLKIKQVLTYITDDKHLFEMYMTSNGEEFKTMEITYTRKK